MIHEIQANFTRGEATPEVHAREDIDLYKAALALCQNFTVMKHGGLRRRSGTRYFGSQKLTTLPVELVPFIFSETQSYFIEFGDFYARFWTDAGLILSGGVPYEIATPYSAAEAATIQYTQLNDIMYIACKTKKPQVLKRFGNANWTISDYVFSDGPYLPINDSITGTVTPSGAPYVGGSVTFTHDTTDNINGGAGFVSTDVGRHYRAQVAGKWCWGTITSITSNKVVVVLIKDSGLTTASQYAQYTRDDTGIKLNIGIAHHIKTTLNPGSVDASIGSLGVGMPGTPNTIPFAGLTIFDQGKTGRFYIEGIEYWCDIKLVETPQKAQVIIGTRVGDLTTFNTLGTVGNTTRTWRLGAFSDTTGWPGSVELFNGRLCWGRSNANPRGVSGSQSNAPNSFSPSAFDGTVTDSNGFFYDVISGRADEILWLKDGPKLQIGTASSIRSLGASAAGEAISPRNVTSRLENSNGCTSTLPIKVGPSTIHAGRFGRTLKDLFYDNTVDTLVAPILSNLSEHLFRKGIKKTAYAAEPDGIIWIVTKDGKLRSTTFDRDEKVIGFADHPMTNAFVESVVSIPSATAQRDVVFLSVRRVVNGSTVRYIEAIEAPFLDMSKEDAFFVDCGATYSGAPVHTITGLSHLEGQTVDILADGAVFPRQAVTGGTVTLPGTQTASKVHVGLPIGARFRTMRTVVPSPEGASLGLKKRIVYAVIDMIDTLGLKCGPTLGKLEAVKLRKPSDPMGQSPSLFTGTARVNIEDSWSSGGQVDYVCDQPLPCTIRAVLTGVEAQP